MSSFYSIPGPAGTIQIGTVTTSPEGTDAAVTNTGTAESAILNFQIPRGDTGTVSTAGLGSAASPSITFIGDTNTGIYSPGADQVAVATNGTGRLFVDASGNVGVGTIPFQSLHVKSTSNGTTARFENNSGNFIDFYETTGGTRIGYLGSLDNTNWTVHNDKNGYLAFDTNNTERLRITSAGLVGIGTSSPAELMQLRGSGATKLLLSSADNTADRGVYFGTSDNTVLGYIKQEYSTGVFEISSGSGTYTSGIGFRTGGVANRVFIDSSGSVGIGTTSPSEVLDVNGTAQASQFKSTGAGGATGYDFSASGSGAGAANVFCPSGYTLGFGTNSQERARIDPSGRLLVGTSSRPNTGGRLCVSNGIGLINTTGANFATVEHGSGTSGSYTTITISATVQDTNASVIFETLMTGFSGVYLDNVSGQYSNQAAVTMRNNASAGTSAALTVNGAGTTYTLTITTAVTHPVVKVKVTAGGLVGDITLPTVTFA